MTDDCLFCKMASGAMDVEKLQAEELVFAIGDMNPRAPTYLRVRPKEHVADARVVSEGHGATLARMFEVARRLAEAEKLRSGYRLAFNVGEDAGMTVSH